MPAPDPPPPVMYKPHIWTPICDPGQGHSSGISQGSSSTISPSRETQDTCLQEVTLGMAIPLDAIEDFLWLGDLSKKRPPLIVSDFLKHVSPKCDPGRFLHGETFSSATPEANRWSSWGSFPLKSRMLRDQICTT